VGIGVDPLGLHDFQIGAEIGAWLDRVLETSVIDANVAVESDVEIFDDPHVAPRHPRCGFLLAGRQP
jgi:hypothetical protein